MQRFDLQDILCTFETQTIYYMNDIFSIRLRQARTIRQLSVDDLGKMVNLSKQEILQYEDGSSKPDGAALIKFSKALGLSLDFFFRPVSVSIESVEFRKRNSLTGMEIDAIKEIVKDRLESFLEIEAIVDEPARNSFVSKHIVECEDDVLPLAEKLKKAWGIGEDGINNVIETLEDNNIKVVEVVASGDFDGLSGFANGKIPFIVLNKNVGSERKRFTALHELAHLLFDCNCMDKRDEEDLCSLFANEMLISKKVFFRKIGENRRDISLLELKDLQVQFGISIDALMCKAKSLNVITKERYGYFRKKKAEDPALKKEVEESRYKEESPKRFERLVHKALASDLISMSKCASLLNVSVVKFREDLMLM